MSARFCTNWISRSCLPYEFGNKVSVAVTSRGGWLVGARSYTGNPYDGHTLAAQMEQVKNMIGNNNPFQGRLQGFLERPGPCKYRS